MAIIDNDIVDKLQKQYKNIKIAYGGDGTLADVWREAYAKDLSVWPIRNYGMCARHQKMLDALANDDQTSLKDMHFWMTVHRLAECYIDNNKSLALNEIQLKSNNITEALRFDVYVNGKRYYENVIADGVIFSTPNGATGYWKSITRTIFREGCGLAFIAPTVGISSLILKNTDAVKIVLSRNADIAVSYDKLMTTAKANKGFEINLEMSTENMSIIGYEHFMCYECRKNRNSTILQDQYIV